MRAGQAVPRTRSVVHRPVHGQRIWAISGQVELRPCWEDGWYQTKGSLVMFADNRRVARPGKNWRRSVVILLTQSRCTSYPDANGTWRGQVDVGELDGSLKAEREPRVVCVTECARNSWDSLVDWTFSRNRNTRLTSSVENYSAVAHQSLLCELHLSRSRCWRDSCDNLLCSRLRRCVDALLHAVR